MSNSQPLPPKKEVALALLERSSVYVHLDPRQTAVVVPAWFRKQPQLVLQIGLNMPVPIPDLRLDEDGLSCTLSFNRAPFYCVVPWASVFAMVGEDGRGMVWPDDVPAEVARQAQVRAVDSPPKEPAKVSTLDREAREGAGKEPASKAKRPRKRTPLSAVPDGDGPAKKAAKSPRHDRLQAAPPARPAVAPVPSPAGGHGGKRQHPAPAPTRGGGSASSKKKRELPPYLRIVK
jgi:stringent starvation protein B